MSNILFSPPHRFSRIFNSLLSNQFYIVFISYTVLPFLYLSIFKKHKKADNPTVKYSKKLSLKKGLKTKSIEVESIHAILTDKPYSVVYTKEQKFLLNRSLKDLERELDPAVFIRVHRSAIINSSFIDEIKSRNNGDYDALTQNGISVRFSRHYRKNWIKLLR